MKTENNKLREALEAIDKNTDLLDIAEDIAPDLHPSHSFVAVQIRKIVRAALAKPSRNCDIGTAEEQAQRFRKFCNAHTHQNGADFECYKDCPARNYINGWGIPYCQLKWAQMPYNEGCSK